MLGVSRGFDEVHLIYRLKHEINSLSPDAAHFLQQVGACHRPWRRDDGLLHTGQGNLLTATHPAGNIRPRQRSTPACIS